ncbi:MAG: twin-arginine translocase TatA/TatE family subunit [Rhodospirillales bacterium]|nr:twin-arginine translocase TatA/TatE family subunit [Rhodospirillales bacterium]
MGAFGIWQWVLVAVIVLLLFGGRGKISGLMGDFAKGINSFKKGLKETDPEAEPGATAKIIENDSETAETGDAAKKDEATKG